MPGVCQEASEEAVLSEQDQPYNMVAMEPGGGWVGEIGRLLFMGLPWGENTKRSWGGIWEIGLHWGQDGTWETSGKRCQKGWREGCGECVHTGQSQSRAVSLNISGPA